MNKSNSSVSTYLFCLISLTAIVIIACLTRPLLPLDETRYAGVAWEMWLNHNWLVPTLNGAVYAHKPPLLFWMINAGWRLFGINEWWLRVLPALFAGMTLLMMNQTAKILWPDKPSLAVTASLVLLGSVFWASWIPLLRFDVILTFFVLLALYGLYKASQQRGSLWIYSLAVGLGILTKGPIILVFTLTPGLLAPYWQSPMTVKPSRWYGNLFIAILMSALIALAWAIPAAWFGGAEYAKDIFLSQNVGRTFSSFAHARPWWWYLPSLPLIFYPWFLWLPFWQALFRIKNFINDSSIRFLLSALLPPFLLLCLISGKQTRYLLPLFPVVSLLLSYLIISIQKPIARSNQWIFTLLVSSVGLFLMVVPHISKQSSLIQDKPWLAHVDFIWGLIIFFLGVGFLFPKFANGEKRIRLMAAMNCLLVICYFAAVTSKQSQFKDGTQLASRVATYQSKGDPVAFIGHYEDQLQFIGRLQKPLIQVDPANATIWAKQHREGWLVEYRSDDLPLQGKPDFSERLDKETLVLWSAPNFEHSSQRTSFYFPSPQTWGEGARRADESLPRTCCGGMLDRSSFSMFTHLG